MAIADNKPTSAVLPSLSVVVPTYQHAAFIEKCIQGILMQQTTFPVEVLIGEDESTDGTREICQRLAAEHPDRIRLFLRSRKDVLYIMGRPTGRANFLALLSEAQGKYIALCEGDDHWTDSLKLQKQVDALEADAQTMGCFTDAWNEHEGQRTAYLDGKYAAPPSAPWLQQRDMLLGQGVPTCTFLFRRDQLLPIPEVLQRSAVADSVLYVHLTRNGHLRFLPQRTAVRTMHAGGAHALSGRLHRTKVKEQVWPLLDEMTHGKYSGEIERMFDMLYASEWDSAVQGKDRPLLKHIWPEVAKRRERMGWSPARTALNWCEEWAPGITNAVHAVWR